MSICTSILSKNHHLNTQNRLKQTKYRAFQELLPREEIYANSDFVVSGYAATNFAR